MEEQTRSLSEVAGLMGVSERTVRRWIHSGRLKAYKPGRDYRIPESGLRTFIEESEISPKVPAPPSPEPTLWNGMLEDEERRYLLALFDTQTSLMSKLSEHYEPLLEQLPEEPPLDELDRYSWVLVFSNTCDIIEDQINGASFAAIAGPWIDRANTEEGVAAEIRRSVHAFQHAFGDLLGSAHNQAVGWIAQQRKRHGEKVLLEKWGADLPPELRRDFGLSASVQRWSAETR